MAPTLVLALVACAPDVGIATPDTEPVLDDPAGDLAVTADDTADDLDDTAAEPVDEEPEEDEPEEDDPTCDPTASWVADSFVFPADALSCSGAQLVRYDAAYALWVGVVDCGGGFVRLYLADDAAGPWLPATDLAGHGQDHCELLDPAFTLGHEDDITSGGCATCATSVNLPLEGQAVWARAFLGDSWTLYDPSGAWSWQTSQIACGVDLVTCGAP